MESQPVVYKCCNRGLQSVTVQAVKGAEILGELGVQLGSLQDWHYKRGGNRCLYTRTEEKVDNLFAHSALNVRMDLAVEASVKQTLGLILPQIMRPLHSILRR